MTEYESKVLAALEGHGALMTRDIAAKVRPIFGHNNRTHSGAVRAWLLDLEKRGLVSRLDEHTPVCWKLTGVQPQRDKDAS